jgi:prolyl-tRNA synthetase
VIKGQKSEKEKFAGAVATYGIEAIMHDGKALQCGKIHNFGDGFARAFGIQFTDKDNTLKHVHQTSWGTTTRMIGAIIMVHGDNDGLVLPPCVAPTQVMIIPIRQQEAGVLEKASEIKDSLKDVRVRIDDSDKGPGLKFAEQEMRGIPLRVEVGPKDIAAGKCVVCRRDTREKMECSLTELAEKIPALLDTIQQDMYDKAAAHLKENTCEARSKEEFIATFNEKGGFVKAMWCGDRACEEAIKEELAVTNRCIPYQQERLAEGCVWCGKKAEKMAYWGRAY